MDKQIEQLKSLYLEGDVDSETYQDNLDRINEWTLNINKNNALLEWQNTDISMDIVKILRAAYNANKELLGTNESLDEVKRNKLWAKQNSIEFILGIMTEDAKGQVHRTEKEIQDAISFGEN